MASLKFFDDCLVRMKVIIYLLVCVCHLIIYAWYCIYGRRYTIPWYVFWILLNIWQRECLCLCSLLVNYDCSNVLALNRKNRSCLELEKNMKNGLSRNKSVICNTWVYSGWTIQILCNFIYPSIVGENEIVVFPRTTSFSFVTRRIMVSSDGIFPPNILSCFAQIYLISEWKLFSFLCHFEIIILLHIYTGRRQDKKNLFKFLFLWRQVTMTDEKNTRMKQWMLFNKSFLWDAHQACAFLPHNVHMWSCR